jgi:cholestenol delta-isomerase
VEGPLCFLAAYAIVYGKPYRHPVQMLISIGQLYGCILYYITAAMEGFAYSRPETQYLIGYFVLMNLPWIIVPFLLIVDSFKATVSAFSGKKKRN